MTAPSSASIPVTLARPAVFAALRAWLYVAVVLCYLIGKVGHLPALAPVLSVLSLAAIIASLPASGWATRLLAALFLASGTWMLVTRGLGSLDFLGAFGEMTYLLALFVLLPICSVPVKLGGYSSAIETVLRGRISGVFQLNCLVTTLAFICGSFMSMAAVPIMMTSMEPVVRAYPIRHPERFIAVSTIYGYALPVLWTPVSGVVGVIVQSLHIDWITLFPALFALSIACLLANWLIFYLIEVRAAPARFARLDLPQGGATSPIFRLMEMVLAIVLLIAAIVLLEYRFQIGLVTVVTLIAIPFALAWSTLIGTARAFMGEARRQTAVRLPRMADQFVIFLSAGFFAQAMRLSGFDLEVNLVFLDLHNAFGTVPFVLSLPPMALLASFMGIHPLVLIALLAESLKPELLGISSLQLAVALIGSAVLTYVVGPFSGTLGLVQSINRVSTFRMSLWNAPYALGFLTLLSAASLLV
jgi:hypothetical protein